MAAAQGGGSGQGEGADKNAYYILWLVALIIFVGAIVWYFFDEPLKRFFILIRIYEIQAVYTVLQWVAMSFPWFGKIVHSLVGEMGAELSLAKELTPTTLSLDIANVLSTSVGEYLRYPVMVYLIFLSLIVFKMNVKMRLRKKFNMRTLARQEQVNWPQIRVVTKLDILDEDLDEGPWAMAMTPMQFAKKNKLVAVELAEAPQSLLSKAQVPEYKVILDPVRTERAFSVQLGRSWYGFQSMTPHRRAILAVLAARGARDTKAALALVDQLAASGAAGNLDCIGTDELWKKNFKNKRVQEICDQHGYEFTIFISMLQFAREDGVIASADFLWVKPIDRRLWYVLNNVGRQTPCVEVAGIFSHWYYEMALKRPLSAPRVDNAVEALRLALSEIIYIPDEKEKEEILKQQESKEVLEESST